MKRIGTGKHDEDTPKPGIGRLMLKRIVIFFLTLGASVLWSARLSAQAASTAKCAHCGKEKFVSVQAKNGTGKLMPLCYECAMLPRCAYCQMPSEAESTCYHVSGL